MDRAFLNGLLLPLITPFREGALDEGSLARLVHHYASEPVDGLILGATTGEGMALTETETERLVAATHENLIAAGRQIPVLLGLSGADTGKLLKALDMTAGWEVTGYLIACPYYLRPTQRGLYEHFLALAERSTKPIVIYNIPYRTGVNLQNETLLRLAEHKNIIGVKDCCADMAQSFDLVRAKPHGFSVLTGEDPLYYNALTIGAEGGIIASAHIRTRSFAQVRDSLAIGDMPAALALWRRLADLPRLLFSEPSPAALKYWLWREGLIDSPEMRSPMTPVSQALAEQLDRMRMAQ